MPKQTLPPKNFTNQNPAIKSKPRQSFATDLSKIKEKPPRQLSVNRQAYVPTVTKPTTSFAERNQAHLGKIKEKRFEENILKELEH